MREGHLEVCLVFSEANNTVLKCADKCQVLLLSMLCIISELHCLIRQLRHEDSLSADVKVKGLLTSAACCSRMWLALVMLTSVEWSPSCACAVWSCNFSFTYAALSSWICCRACSKSFSRP